MKTIKIKGKGNISIKPDLTIITMGLVSIKDKYEDAVRLASESLESIENAIIGVGFKKEDIKTSNFNISANYENYYDEKNNYKKKFKGYICKQDLKLEFDFDTKLLGRVISAIGKISVNPELNIQFSIKDKEAVNQELLEKATDNARRKAEILIKASGKTLGDLVNIEYNWGEIHLYSPTSYNMFERSIALSDSYVPDITPEDISLSDTVLFVWEIE